MPLLTPELLERFRQVGRQSASEDPLVICKFFNPLGAGTWLATEYLEEEKLFYGYVSLFNNHCNEWGYFSLEELESYRHPLGLGIERDLYFPEMPMSEAAQREAIYYPTGELAPAY
jgi:hypothetical protein